MLPQEIPDISQDTNLYNYVLDPLTVIVKLAIISNKADGAKFRVAKNVMYIQETGMWQGLVRSLYGSNKTEIQYLYNPIHLACCHFLNIRYVDKTPKIANLFKAAIKGLEALKITYKQCPVIVICINNYINLIENYLEGYYNDTLFKHDLLTPYYRNEDVELMHTYWSGDRIKFVLDIIDFLDGNGAAGSYVQSLEIFINNVDSDICNILRK